MGEYQACTVQCIDIGRETERLLGTCQPRTAWELRAKPLAQQHQDAVRDRASLRGLRDRRRLLRRLPDIRGVHPLGLDRIWAEELPHQDRICAATSALVYSLGGHFARVLGSAPTPHAPVGIAHNFHLPMHAEEC